LKAGKSGKGHQGGYISYCSHCQIEYKMFFKKCNHCNRDTQDEEERMADLKDRTHDYKEKKQKKILRRAKWENWKKTQEMFYKKSSTNYHKWDVFESSESEHSDDEPIVPKDNPTFQAMEQDIKERGFRRRRDKKQATILKNRGNDMMKRGLYKTANQCYSEGLELCRDFFVMYTNRALARIKICMY